MDRRTRRIRDIRVRSRRIKLVAALSIAAASVVALAATAFGQQGSGTPELPKPQVDVADLTSAQQPVDPGWESQVGTDANLVAVQWNGDSSAQFTFEVRNGDGEWHKAADSQAFDNGPDSGSADARNGGATPQTKNVTEPVWIGRDVTGVRLRLDDGSAQDVTLHVIDSTRGKKPDANIEGTTDTSPPSSAPPPPPAPSGPAQPPGGSPSTSTTTTTTTTTPLQSGVTQGLAAAALATLAVAFIVRRRRALAVVVAGAVLVFTACAPTKPPAPGAPGIVPRSSWGGDLGQACSPDPPAPYLSEAVVHHTAGSNNYGPGDSVSIIRGIYAYHVYTLGYCDIAYNFLLDDYGQAFEGRWNSMNEVVTGAHTLNDNYSTVGIAVLGTFISFPPSGSAEGTLMDLIRWKFKLHGVNPFDRSDAHIVGHRDRYPTECPGQAFYNDLGNIRWGVEATW